MQDAILYNTQVIGFLEEIWGDGFLSPGGPDEVARVITGVDIADKFVLDIGSGSGACAVLLVCEHDAARVIGVDVENPVCEAANRRAKLAALKTGLRYSRLIRDPFRLMPQPLISCSQRTRSFTSQTRPKWRDRPFGC